MSGLSIRALLCLGSWNEHKLIKVEDVQIVVAEADDGTEEFVRED